MNVLNGTVPHYIKVQMGNVPDVARDGVAAPYIPLDESSYGVAGQLAALARTLVEASEQMTGPCSGAKVVNVDGTNCAIPVSEDLVMIREISRLVAPRGWDNG